MGRGAAVVAVNERGRRIGESHPRAKLTDHEVDLLREFIDQLIAGGMRPMQAYREAAVKFEIHLRTAKKIVYCERRAETVAGHRRVRS